MNLLGHLLYAGSLLAAPGPPAEPPSPVATDRPGAPGDRSHNYTGATTTLQFHPRI